MLLRIWDMFIILKATYGIHLVPLSDELQELWENLEKHLLVNTMGCYSGRHRTRLRMVGRMFKHPQIREARTTALQQCVARRSTTENSEVAIAD